MNLTIDEIRAITCGTVSVTEEQDGMHFYRFTPEQMELYKKRDAAFYDKCYASAGIRLRFSTDSRTLFLRLCVTPQSGSRTFFGVDIFVNGKCVDTVENYSDLDLSGDYTAVPAYTGEFSKNIRLGRGEKEVCILLPWNMHTVLKSLALDDSATLTPVKPTRKLLCFGDSITQGYDALCPSNRYTSQLADWLDAEEFNKAIGGEVFFPELANTKESFIPDYITVAYGTNDFSKIPYESFLQNCKDFYENLSRTYPQSRIYAITPIWRKDYEKDTDFPDFFAVKKHIEQVAAHLPKVRVIDGFHLMPHHEKYCSDLYLHPSDKGFKKYAKNLIKQIKKQKK